MAPPLDDEFPPLAAAKEQKQQQKPQYLQNEMTLMHVIRPLAPPYQIGELVWPSGKALGW